MWPMAEPIDETASAHEAVRAVTSAYERAASAIRDMTDPDAAFAAATRLGENLVKLSKDNRVLRGDCLRAVRDLHGLELGRELAAHVTRTGVPVTRQRVDQIMKEGNAA